MSGLSRADRVLPRRIGSFPGRAMVLHIGEGCLRGSIRVFPHDSGVLTRMLVFSARAPMCRAGPSAHGRISTALSVGAFPHDYVDSPPAGPGRMCSTASARPMPRIRARRRRPDTAEAPPPRTRPPAPSRGFRPPPGSFPPERLIAPLRDGGRRAGESEVRASHPFEPPDRPSPARVRACGGANGAEPGISGGNPPGRGGRRAQ